MKKFISRELRSSARIIILSILTATFLMACGSNESMPSEESSSVIVEFKSPIKASELFSLLLESSRSNQAVRVFVSYGETKASWLVPENIATGQMEWLIKKSMERLTFLRSNFKEKDALEGRVYNELNIALQNLQASKDVDVKKVMFNGGVPERIRNHRLTSKVYEKKEKLVKMNEDKGGNIGLIKQALYDYPDDAGHVPVTGTSTFYSDGVLHKLWFDSSAVSYYNSYWTLAYMNGNKAPAFEIDSMFQSSQSGAYVVSCGDDSSNEVGNLPAPYVDTELFDGGNWRVCTVGTQLTSNLQTWYLYWTWRSLDGLKTWEYPKMRMILQPSEKCSWCSDTNYYIYPEYCTCGLGAYGSTSNAENNDGDPWYQYIIDYYYYEKPGVEVQWYRN